MALSKLKGTCSVDKVGELEGRIWGAFRGISEHSQPHEFVRGSFVGVLVDAEVEGGGSPHAKGQRGADGRPMPMPNAEKCYKISQRVGTTGLNSAVPQR